MLNQIRELIKTLTFENREEVAKKACEMLWAFYHAEGFDETFEIEDAESMVWELDRDILEMEPEDALATIDHIESGEAQ